MDSIFQCDARGTRSVELYESASQISTSSIGYKVPLKVLTFCHQAPSICTQDRQTNKRRNATFFTQRDALANAGLLNKFFAFAAVGVLTTLNV